MLQKFMFRVLLVVKNMEFLVMTNRLKFGERFLLKRELMRKLLSLILRRMVISLGFKVVEFSFIMIKKTGGVVAAVWNLRRLVIHVVQIQKYFMILVKKIMTQVLVKRILRAIAVVLWKSVTKYLCNIDDLKMDLSSHLKIKMLTLVVV